MQAVVSAAGRGGTVAAPGYNLSTKHDTRCQELRRRVENMKTLHGKIAIVGGASRGAGRGIALALGDAGATVYVAARTTRESPKPSHGVPGTVEDTAEEVTRRGGVG